jgi:hypothetical protein
VISRIHSKLGTAGFIISIVALVAALGGGAYAASGGLSGKQKTEVEKIAKKYAGKPGANGAPGAAGPQGPGGAAGAKGDAGSTGNTGAAGKSVNVGTATISQCEEGGITVGVEGSSATPVCNGEEGPEGPEGALGTAGTTLPAGASETGVWSFGGLQNNLALPEPEIEKIILPISFTVPLSGQLTATECGPSAGPGSGPGPACQVHYINAMNKEVLEGGEKVTSTVCTGTALEPKATPGNLCVYTKTLTAVNASPNNGSIGKGGGPQGGAGALTAGAFLTIVNPEKSAIGTGSWAVTAPTTGP